MPHIICTVTNDLSYDQRMQRICRSLSRAGYEVTLVGRERPFSPPLRSEPFRQVRLQCQYDSGKMFYFEYNWLLFHYLLEEPFDVVCAVDLDTILPAFLASRRLGRPCVYDAHEYFTEVPEIVRRPVIRKVWEMVARFTIPRMTYAYTVGPALAEILEARYGIPFYVIRNIQESGNPSPAEKKADPPVILYQGALNEGRGLEQAIVAMRQIDNAQLWLAGEGDLSRSLRQLATRLKVNDRVRFLGYVLPEELKKLTPQATIGLNLLEDRGLSYYYSLANKTFDYIQAGVPSIQMAFPEYRRLQEEYDIFYLIPTLKPNLIAEAIQRLLTDKDLYQKLQANNRRAARSLTWEKEERVLLNLYNHICPPGEKSWRLGDWETR